MTQPLSLYAPVTASKAFAITPDDDAPLPTPTLKLYVGGTGDVACVMNEDTVTSGPETLNPATSDATHAALSNGNLTYTNDASANWSTAKSLDIVTSAAKDKFYMEYTVTNPTGTLTAVQTVLGLCTAGWTNTVQIGGGTVASNHSIGFFADVTGLNVQYDNGTSDFNGAGTLVTGDVVGIGLDMLNQAVSWYKNGTLIHTTNLTQRSLNGLNWNFAASVKDQGTVPAVTAAFDPVAHQPAGFSLLHHLLAGSVIFKSMAVGVYNFSIKQVLFTGTTATNLIGLV